MHRCWKKSFGSVNVNCFPLYILQGAMLKICRTCSRVREIAHVHSIAKIWARNVTNWGRLRCYQSIWVLIYCFGTEVGRQRQRRSTWLLPKVIPHLNFSQHYPLSTVTSRLYPQHSILAVNTNISATEKWLYFFLLYQILLLDTNKLSWYCISPYITYNTRHANSIMSSINPMRIVTNPYDETCFPNEAARNRWTNKARLYHFFLGQVSSKISIKSMMHCWRTQGQRHVRWWGLRRMPSEVPDTPRLSIPGKLHAYHYSAIGSSLDERM